MDRLNITLEDLDDIDITDLLPDAGLNLEYLAESLINEDFLLEFASSQTQGSYQPAPTGLADNPNVIFRCSERVADLEDQCESCHHKRDQMALLDLKSQDSIQKAELPDEQDQDTKPVLPTDTKPVAGGQNVHTGSPREVDKEDVTMLDCAKEASLQTEPFNLIHKSEKSPDTKSEQSAVMAVADEVADHRQTQGATLSEEPTALHSSPDQLAQVEVEVSLLDRASTEELPVHRQCHEPNVVQQIAEVNNPGSHPTDNVSFKKKTKIHRRLSAAVSESLMTAKKNELRRSKTVAMSALVSSSAPLSKAPKVSSCGNRKPSIHPLDSQVPSHFVLPMRSDTAAGSVRPCHGYDATGNPLKLGEDGRRSSVLLIKTWSFSASPTNSSELLEKRLFSLP